MYFKILHCVSAPQVVNASSKKNVAFNDEFFASIRVDKIDNGFVQCNSHVGLKNACSAASASIIATPLKDLKSELQKDSLG